MIARERETWQESFVIKLRNRYEFSTRPLSSASKPLLVRFNAGKATGHEATARAPVLPFVLSALLAQSGLLLRIGIKVGIWWGSGIRHIGVARRRRRRRTVVGEMVAKYWISSNLKGLLGFWGLRTGVYLWCWCTKHLGDGSLKLEVPRRVGSVKWLDLRFTECRGSWEAYLLFFTFSSFV